MEILCVSVGIARPLRQVIILGVIFACLISTQGNGTFTHETGEEKSSSFSKSQEAGQSSQVSYTRVSGAGFGSKADAGLEARDAVEIKPSSFASSENGFQDLSAQHQASRQEMQHESRHSASRQEMQQESRHSASRQEMQHESRHSASSHTRTAGSREELGSERTVSSEYEIAAAAAAAAAAAESASSSRHKAGLSTEHRRTGEKTQHDLQSRGLSEDGSRQEQSDGSYRASVSTNTSSSQTAGARRSNSTSRVAEQAASSSRMSELDRASVMAADTEQRSYFQELFSRSCKDCVVKGQRYQGHSRFQFDENCNRFRCICNCDGSYNCPAAYTINICKEGQDADVDSAREQQATQRRRCQQCNALGQTFEGNSYFDVQDNCIKHRGCICYCNGTWSCPAERAVNTCEEAAASASRECRACNAKGKVVPGDSYFELDEPCKKFRYCRCRCDGSWNCPAENAEDTCQTKTQVQELDTTCRRCSAKGKEVPGNTYFELTDGCIEYKNCACYCNGSWVCPQRFARNTCQGTGEAERDPTECQSCSVFGKQFRGNSYFQVENGCTRYSNCVCRCDGSWDCPQHYAADICSATSTNRPRPKQAAVTTAPTTTTVSDIDKVDDRSCSYCDARGKIVPSNSYFNLTIDCIHYTQCLCHCDGSWACPSHYARNICDAPPPQRGLVQTPAESCRSCIVNTRVVQGNTYFHHLDGCYRYSNCLCNCDGSYQCQASNAENICQASSSSSNQTSSSSSSASSSSSSSAAVAASSSSASDSSSSVSSSSVSATVPCLKCFANGQLRAANTRFLYTEGCHEYNCDCHCNGSYSCPPERTRNTCRTGCAQCEVDGEVFSGNNHFTHTRGCIEHSCTCYCNGTWVCPKERAVSKCPRTAGQDGRVTVTDLSSKSRCSQCVSSDKRTHPPETDFGLEDGCIHYQCRCKCDGSWECPGDTARNICRGETPGGCRSCIISESQIFRGNEDFSMRQGCILYQCRCNCDGSWECPGEKARDVCLGEVPGGCRVCRVSKNEVYRGETEFPLRQGCNHYTCKCHCNGSWECPGETARDVCIGEIPGGCRVCKLEGGEIYLGESNFQLFKNCIHYQCRCNCDGSWNCPGNEARRICNADGSPATERPQRQLPTEAQEICFACVVSGTEQFRAREPFTLRRGCLQYQCDCNCDGSWNCPAERTRNICERQDDPILRAETCQSCQIATYVFPGSSSFLLTHGCEQYACLCDCRGRWTCNHTSVRNICKDGVTAESVRDAYSSSRNSSEASVSSVTSDSRRQAQNTISSSSRQKFVDTTHGATKTETDLSSVFQKQFAVPSANCVLCLVEGKEYEPNSDFVLVRVCKQYHCFCDCNGRWRCPRERTVNLCASTNSSASLDRQSAQASTASYQKQRTEQGSQQSDRSKTSVSQQASTASSQNQRTEQGSQQSDRSRTSMSQQGSLDQRRYESSRVRVIGQTNVNTSSTPRPASQRPGSDRSQGNDQQQVHSYYVNFTSQVDSRHTGDQGAYRGGEYGQPDSRTIDTYGIESRRSGLDESSSQSAHISRQMQQQHLYDQENAMRGTSVNKRPGQVYGQENVDTGRSTAHHYGQSQVAYASSASSSSGSSSFHGTSDSDASGVVSAESSFSMQSREDGTACVPCQVDDKTYHAGAQFDWRRGCVIYKCNCFCNGYYRCRLTLEPGCSPDGSIPMPDISPNKLQDGNTPQQTSTCGNCYVQGFLFPGNMSFTLRQGCDELACKCGCDGAHECLERKPIQGCTAVSTPLAGAIYPYGITPALYPLGTDGHASFPVRPGRVYTSFHQVFSSGNVGTSGGCLTCGQQSGNPRLSPQDEQNFNSPQASQQRSNIPRTPQRTQNTQFHIIPMEPVSVSDAAEAASVEDKNCAACFINGRSYRGNFKFIKDCYHVTCYCDCSGFLRCSVESDRTPACPVRYGPVSGQCRSCVVEGNEYPPSIQFALRIGCYAYDCMCGCDGLWVCPTQAPTNYCVRPALSPSRVGNDPYGILAAGYEPGHEQVEELRDNAFSVGLTGERLTNCWDCEVRGTTYSSESKFFLRDGCLQHTCQCACDGSWACPKSDTINVCEQDHQRHQTQEQRLREEQERVLPGVVLHHTQTTDANPDHCQSCHVNGKNYPTKANFQFRMGCHVYSCHCFCNGSWECPALQTRDLCTSTDRRVDGCHHCQVNNRTYPGNSAFAYRVGCLEHNCRCACNGQVDCPPDRSRNLCNAEENPLEMTAPGKTQDDAFAERTATSGSSSQCQPCMVEGERIPSRTEFGLRRGCNEFLCECACNGTWSCPKDRSFNFCDLDNLQEPGADLATQPRKGCTVGNKTYFTRLFTFYDSCIQYMCVCYDSGAWRCPSGKERRVC